MSVRFGRSIRPGGSASARRRTRIECHASMRSFTGFRRRDQRHLDTLNLSYRSPYVRLRFLTTVLTLSLALPVLAGDAFVLRAISEQPSPIAIEISGSSVTATGLTPGGAVAVVAAWNTTVQGWSKAGHTWQDARAAANGVVQTTFPNPIPPGAFLAVIDVATGRVVEKTDAAQTFQRVELPEKRLKRDSKREVGEIWSPLPRAMIVWI